MGVRGGSFTYSGRRGSAAAVNPPPPVGPAFYASNAGGGSGLSSSSPCKVSEAWALMAPYYDQDPTLWLLDGTYQGINSMIQPTISGTASSFITIRAVNEGQVLIDGQSARQPIYVFQQDYINIIGVNAKRSNLDCVSLSGAFGCLIQRVCAWDAVDHNRVVLVSNYGRGNVFEDCAAFGVGRKQFASYQTAGPCTFRRIWSRWQKSTCNGPKISGTLAYDSYFNIFENCIGTWDNGYMPDPYTLLVDNGTAQSQAPNAPGTGCKQVGLPYGVVQGDSSCLINSQVSEQNFGTFSADGVGTTTGTNIQWNPAVSYNAAPRNQAIVWDTVDDIVYFSLQDNNINHNPHLTVGTWWSPVGSVFQSQSQLLGCISYQKLVGSGQLSALGPGRGIFFSNIDGITVQDCCAILPNDPSYGPTTLTGGARQAVFLNAGTAGSHSALVARNVTSFRGQAAAPTYNIQWNPVNCVNATTPAAYYPGGQSLYSNDGAHGAAIRYRYVNGILTSDALWPWPMNQRIIDATTASGYQVEDVNATIQGFFGTFI